MGLNFTGQWVEHDELNKFAMAGVPFTVWGEQRDHRCIARLAPTTVRADTSLPNICSRTVHGARRTARLDHRDFGSHELRIRRDGYLLSHQQAGLEPELT